MIVFLYRYLSLYESALKHTHAHTHVCVCMFSISGNLFHFGCVAAVAFADVAVIVDCRSMFLYIYIYQLHGCMEMFYGDCKLVRTQQTIFVVFQFLLCTSCVL